jgi:hypothetical protein
MIAVYSSRVSLPDLLKVVRSLTRVPKPPTASPAAPAAAGPCSKAEATTVVGRLGLGDDSLPNPVYAVICGAFTGPGSQAMVVSLATGGTSIPFGGWAVFRRSGGAWRLVMQQRNGAEVSAAGSGIRQTVGISRPGDPRCCPSGGTKSRIWRWDGTRLVAGAWTQTRPGSAPPATGQLRAFKTPSGNIVCVHDATGVVCAIKSGLEPPPPPRRPGCLVSNDVSLRVRGRAATGPSICPGEPEGDAGALAMEPVARVLAYGATWRGGGGLRCNSAATGLTCRNNSGHGFFLSRERWRAF